MRAHLDGNTMKIEAIELFHVRMPLREPFRTAFGTALHNDSVLVRFASGQYEGWGEAAPGVGPHYSAEWGGGAFAVLKDVLAPIVLGEDIADTAQLQTMLSGIKGNHFAKAALDVALWDLMGKSAGRPVWQMIGGKASAIEVGEDFGILDTIDDLLDRIGDALDNGMKRIKLKANPGWDVGMLEAVRNRFPDAPVHIDCNAAYTLADLDHLKSFDRFGLVMIEQPLGHDDLVDHARLQSELKTPICLDESITSRAKAENAIDIGACRWINLKTGRVGGLTNAIDIHDMCARRGVPCWVGFSIESALGQAQNLTLASLSNNLYPADAFASDRFYRDDICRPRIRYDGGGVISIPEGAGFGVAPDRELLETCTLARWTSSDATPRQSGWEGSSMDIQDPQNESGRPAGQAVLTEVVRQVHWGSRGFSSRADTTPRIGIVKSNSDVGICYSHLDELAGIARDSIGEEGGMGFAIPTAGPCDGLFFANNEGRRLAPSIQRMAADVEMMGRGAGLDAVLFLSSCDTTTPAHLVSAAKLGLPAVFLPGGYQSPGSLEGKPLDLMDVYEAVGSVLVGDRSREDLRTMASHAVTGPGVCPGIGTATTIHMLLEALGLAPLGCTPQAGSAAKLRSDVAHAARLVCAAARADLTPRGIVTPQAIDDAVALLLAVGGAPSSIVFLQLLADELGLRLDVRERVRAVGQTIRQLCSIAPCGTVPVSELEKAGGTVQLLKRLEPHLHLDRPTVEGKTLGEALARRTMRPAPGVFRDDAEAQGEPGLMLLDGTLAPGGCVVRPGIVPFSLRRFRGRTRLFSHSSEGYSALGRGEIHAGDALVFRGSGIDDFACAIAGTALVDSVVLISDFGFSGLSRGLCVGYVRPGVTEDGPIAHLKEGDEIVIDLERRRIDSARG